MPKINDISGKMFSSWLVMHIGKNTTRIYWKCVCVCGKEKEVLGCHLVSGKSTNCGCSTQRGKDKNALKHGLRGTKNYALWSNIIDRTENKNNNSFHRYGGKGIRICSEWRNDFVSFNSYIGERPTSIHSLDRIDGSKGYEPGNVRWATPKEQARNTCRNVFVDFDGKRTVLSEACELSGVSYGAAIARIRAGHDWKTSRR